MPIKKKDKSFEPLWKDWDKKAQKEGLHATFYTVNQNEYIGEWHDNNKEGKGVYNWVNKGIKYEGEWKSDKRNGFGNLSCKDKDGNYKKVYSGGWKDDKYHGYGTYYYSENEFYEGEWYDGKRSGWGRHICNQDIYEGEWLNDERYGNGMEVKANGDRYEGEWKFNKKNGNGKYFFLSKGKLLDGFWVNDINKCGNMVDFDRDNAKQANLYEIPKIYLKDPSKILNQEIKNLTNF